ncbi:MAG: hypothetical protein Kow0047_14470 [Anaerolineae bacterium]
MYPLDQVLSDTPLPFLRVIATLRGVSLQSQRHEEVVAELAVALSDPERIAQGLAELSEGARAALERLAALGGHMQSAQFQRQYGQIRPFGPGRLARERPWESPTGPAEELWYRGWIFRGFAQIGGAATEVVFVPEEIAALLPSRAAPGFDVPAESAPKVIADHGDALAHDMLTLLAMTQVEGMRIYRGQWLFGDLAQLRKRLRVVDLLDEPPAPHGRLMLLCHLARRLEWVREDGERFRLKASTLRPWLEASRGEQWAYLWRAWLEDETWDDFRLLPGLICEGNWSTDPVGTRRRLLDWLSHWPEGRWCRLEAVVQAAKETIPEFMRPSGDFDSWYVRDAKRGSYLRGFEHWDDLEGRVLRYMLRGPLHWMGVVALDPGGELATVTAAGQALMQGRMPDVPVPHLLQVQPDFAILAPEEAPLFDRFRVARFAEWESSPAWNVKAPYRYRVTRTSLARAQAQGIKVDQIVHFLRERAEGEGLERMVRALQRYPGRTAQR